MSMRGISGWRGSESDTFQETEVPRFESRIIIGFVTHIHRTLDGRVRLMRGVYEAAH